jgi:pre-rRNA-processing protein IPI3
LPVTAIALSATGSFPTHTRLLTASLDHTVKLWSLSSSTPVLLKSWHLPVAPTSLAWDALQRGFWAAGGDELWGVGMWSADDGEDVAGGLSRGKEQGWRGELKRLEREGEGYFRLTAAGDKKEPITALGLSLTSTTLLVGTASGAVHTLSLPSLQPLKVANPQAHKGCPITLLEVQLKPADLYGQVQLGSTTAGARDEVIRKVGQLERMRVGRRERERHVVETRLGSCEDVSWRPGSHWLLSAGG